MSNTKISAESSAVALTGAELILGVQAGANVKILASQLAEYQSNILRPLELYEFSAGPPVASSKVVRLPMVRAVDFPANFKGSYAAAGTAATASSVFTIQKNGVSIGSITFSAAAVSGVFATVSGAAQTLVAGDVLSIIAPSPADATLADMGFALCASANSVAPPVPAAGGDPYFANVMLLLHFEGANGQTTTVDSSSYGRSVTRNTASTVLTTDQSQFGTSSAGCNPDITGWSVTSSPDLCFGAGQFTVETWIRFSSAPGNSPAFILSQWGPLRGTLLAMYNGSLGFSHSADGTTSTYINAPLTPVINVWHHIAVDRDSSNMIRLYFNGAVIASGISTDNFYDTSQPYFIGGTLENSPGPQGYIDEVRVTKGVARYGGAFTPPTAAFPNH